jgi:hypothetical protein
LGESGAWVASAMVERVVGEGQVVLCRRLLCTAEEVDLAVYLGLPGGGGEMAVWREVVEEGWRGWR